MKFNLKTIIFSIIFILNIFITFNFINNNFNVVDFKSLATDSGFDSSWDSGGSWDSGDSWDSGSSWDSSGSGGVYTSSDDMVIITAWFVLMIIIYIYCLNHAKNKQMLNTNFDDIPQVSNKELETFEIKNAEELCQNAYDSYVAIQKAWSDNNIDKARHLLSDELFNTYKTQLLTLKNKSQKNVMSDFNKIGVKISNISKENETIKMKIALRVSCKDYLIDEIKNTVVRGDSSVVNDYLYMLEFVLSEKNSIDQCPNCFAKLHHSGKSVKCEYCGSVINRNARSMTLINKKMLKQALLKK